jgi:hypothetical protein
MYKWLDTRFEYSEQLLNRELTVGTMLFGCGFLFVTQSNKGFFEALAVVLWVSGATSLTVARARYLNRGGAPYVGSTHLPPLILAALARAAWRKVRNH